MALCLPVYIDYIKNITIYVLHRYTHACTLHLIYNILLIKVTFCQHLLYITFRVLLAKLFMSDYTVSGSSKHLQEQGLTLKRQSFNNSCKMSSSPCQVCFYQHFALLLRSWWELKNVSFITQVKYCFLKTFLMIQSNSSSSSFSIFVICMLKSVPGQGAEAFAFSRWFILRGCASNNVEELTEYSQ